MKLSYQFFTKDQIGKLTLQQIEDFKYLKNSIYSHESSCNVKFGIEMRKDEFSSGEALEDLKSGDCIACCFKDDEMIGMIQGWTDLDDKSTY